MLSDSRVEANIPAGDLKRAREFYADKLGLTPTADMMGMNLRYQTSGGTTFNIYQTQFAGQAGHTIAQWHVTDLEGEVADLKAKGVQFEVYADMTDVEWRNEIAVLPGFGKAAWFKDSEGNILCLDEEETQS